MGDFIVPKGAIGGDVSRFCTQHICSYRLAISLLQSRRVVRATANKPFSATSRYGLAKFCRHLAFMMPDNPSP